ncbi:hypothetical protein RKE38_09920 [Phycicoccus sp. M110.8]|uniref:hypothetical protein n=1 Tax=Phycicoccus sp. M110.8 TaxID=3075433 RepID=UPI0028FD2AD5|nr:hypothetical protein [Phycicoccus sp. M110.8]MDU0314001.1 hypothetical protein [Phycicoccus sp. M110.8]
MAPDGVVSREPPACTVVSGGGVAGLAAACDRLGVEPAGPAVVLTRVSPPTPASAAVVHTVVDLLHQRGCDDVSVGVRLTVGDHDRGHRSATLLAVDAGLTGRTDEGRSYAVVDLADDLVTAPVPDTAVLSGQLCSAVWAAARTRVVVGRAVTDLVDGFAGSLETLLGAAPEVAGAEPADVAVDLLARLPPTLVVVDALAPAGGVDGARLPAPADSGAAGGVLVVATDAVLADTCVAALLGQDRGASRLVGRAVERLGASPGRLEGRVPAPSRPLGPHPRLRAAAAALAAEPRLERVLRAAVGGHDEGGEPADPVLSALRSLVTPLVEAADDPAGQLALESLLTLAHGVAGSARAWAVSADKEAVDRREVPLGFDPADWPGEAYDGLPAFLAPFEALLDGTGPNADGMRWRLVDGATVFEVSREVPADFDAWVARVDVAAGISLMADYLGGRRVAVPGSPDPGATRQAERNLYLPQPNWVAAWGGRAIDVGKIELVERRADEHRLTWRTVLSPNGSATYDDGLLSFRRSGRGTRVTVRGRQLFSLPPAWAGVDLDLWPEVRTPLLEEAYRRFFTTTFDNLEACFEGREFRIGRPPPDPGEPLLTRSVELLLSAAREWVADRTGSREPTAGDPAQGPVVDDHGFTHVRGPR